MVNLMKKLETVDDEAATANVSAEPNQALQPQPPKLQPRTEEAEIEASIIVEKREERQHQVFSGKNKGSLEDDDTANIKAAAVLAFRMPDVLSLDSKLFLTARRRTRSIKFEN